MADSTPAVQTELAAALAALEPQIKGLQGLAATGVSSETVAVLNREASTQIERRQLIENVQTAIGALQANGYPNVPLVSAPSHVIAELQDQQAADAAAIGLFNEVVAVTGDTSRVTRETQPRPTQE